MDEEQLNKLTYEEWLEFEAETAITKANRLINAQEILDMTDEEWVAFCGCSLEDLDESDLREELLGTSNEENTRARSEGEE